MANLSPHHVSLNDEGIGKCSVPMWAGGTPSAFCDKPAYGHRPQSATHCRWDGHEYRDDGRYAGFVPALACAGHGGPDSRVFLDGNAYCAVRDGFTNIQESPVGFGTTPAEARLALQEAQQ